jgi:hypothetical protein
LKFPAVANERIGEGSEEDRHLKKGGEHVRKRE